MGKAILVGMAALLLAGSAQAKGHKASKPVVCEDYSIVEDRGASEQLVAVCYDKHVEGGLTLMTWTEVKVASPSGTKTVVVGWR